MANEIAVKVKGKDELSDVLDKSGEKAERTGNRFKGFGDQLGSAAKEKLEPFSGALNKAGIDLEKMSAGGMVAGAAVAGLATFIGGGIQKLDELIASTEQYRAAANLSYEEASKLGGAFQSLGIEAETGADVIKTLAEEAGDAPEKFAQFGVEIVKAKDGSVDMVETLKNVSDRFRNMKDPAERAAMGAALFGDTWLEIAPFLERGADGVQELIDGVDDSRIVTEESARSQKEYKQAMRELTTSVENLQMALAKDALPLFIDDLRALGDTVEVVGDINNKVNILGFSKNFLDGLNPLKSFTRGITEYKDRQREANEATEEGAEVVDEQAKKLQEEADAADAAASKIDVLKRHQADMKIEAENATKALDDQRRALDDLYDSVLDVVDGQIRYEEAIDRADDSVRDLEDSQRKLNDKLNDGESSSDDIADATEDYDDKLRSATKAIDDAAKAEADKQQAQAAAAGVTWTAWDYTNAYRDALGRARDTINDPNLRQGLDNLWTQVNDQANVAWKAQQQYYALEAAARRVAAISSGVGTTSSGMIIGSADRMERIAGRASGGPVSAGTPYLVGEEGMELFVPDQSGTIIPNHALTATGGRGGGGGGDVYNISVQALDGRGAAEAVVRALRDAKRYGLSRGA